MAEIQIRLQKEKAGAALVEPLFLLAGELGLLLLLQEVRGFSFSLWAVCPAAALLCGGLWCARRKGSGATAAVLGGFVLLCAVGAYFFREGLAAQLQYLWEVFFSDTTPTLMDTTGSMLLLTAGMVALLFIGECLLKCHWPFALLMSCLPLLWVLAGFRVNLWALAFLTLFIGGFWAIRGKKGNVSHGTGISAAVFLLAVLLFSWPVAARFSEKLSLPAYRAEETAYRIWRRFSGSAPELYVNGGVSRGNHYQTGAVMMELSTTRQPSEALYLRGFAGGDYWNGQWLPAEDGVLLEQVKEILNWGNWSNMVDGMYRTMYYVVNRYVIRDEPPTPMSITICYNGDKYPDHFAPYYSRLTSDWLTAEDGYTCEFYEPGDMLLDWEKVPDSFSMQRDWNRAVYDAYAQQAAAAYTGVPAERVPRLARLAAEHPLDDREEITAFILQTLRGNAVYSQTPGWTPMGEDVVEDFLFEKHSGYCVHYASAAALLYRLYGIPARYAAGYLVPPEEFSPGEAGDWTASVTDELAHAWVEIFLPDYGWTPVEVTPDFRGEITVRYPGFDWSTADQGPEEERDTIPVLNTEQSVSFPVQNKVPAGSAFPKEKGQWALWLYLVICLAVFGFLFLDVRREEILRRQSTAGCRETFSRLLEMFRFCGVMAGHDGIELDFAQRTAREIPAVSCSEWEAVLRYTTMAAYGRGTPEPAGDAFVREVYQRACRFLYLRLPWHKKLLFRLGKAFL